MYCCRFNTSYAMLLDFYSPDCYLSKLGRESHRFSFVTFCTVNGPEFGWLFSAVSRLRAVSVLGDPSLVGAKPADVLSKQ